MLVKQETNATGQEMYLTFVGLTEVVGLGNDPDNLRFSPLFPHYIAYSLAVPYFPISPYTLQCADDYYCLSLSTYTGDITYMQIDRLYTSFLRHVLAVDRVLISRSPATLYERRGLLKLRKPSPSTLLIMNNVEVELVSRRVSSPYSPTITDATVSYATEFATEFATELCLTALSVTEIERGLDARLSRQAYERNHMTTRGYWYVAA